MSTSDNISMVAVIVSSFSAIISLAALIYSIYLSKKNERNTTLFNNLSSIINVEAELGNIPSALKFHGIDQDELKQKGVNPKEFAYLITSFTAGGIYYKTYFPNDDKPFEKDSYRYEICKSVQQLEIWPYLKKFITNTNYRKKIENTIIEIEQSLI